MGFALRRRFSRAPLVVRAVLVLVGASLAASLSLPAVAQQGKSKDYALIVGTVWGPDNRPVAGIPIKIRPATGKKAKWELMSDSRGEFAQRVPPGAQDYIIQANIKTPKGQPKPEITIKIADNERQDVGLHLTELPPKK
jgi:hypothetical protein